ncbi:MAG: kelch repeat-containing protein [Holophaga sp.]
MSKGPRVVMPPGLSSLLVGLALLLGPGCEKSEAARRSDFERDLELGKVDETGKRVRVAERMRPKKIPSRPPERWLESTGLPPVTLQGNWGSPLDLGVAFPAPQSTLLEDGSFLLTGGRTGNPLGSKALLFNPASGALRPLAMEVPLPPGSHIALKLPDGSVFLIKTGAGIPSTARVIPWENRVDSLPAPLPTRTAEECRGTLLPDGRVLLFMAGYDAEQKPCAQVYDPKDRQWRLTEPPPFFPARGVLTWLGEGRLLITGGWDAQKGGNLHQAMIFDPQTGHFKETGPMHSTRRNHTATLLPTGHVLIAGGYDTNQELDTTELFDPVARTFHPGPKLPFPLARHGARLLGSGNLLLSSGSALLLLDGHTLQLQILKNPEAIVPDASGTDLEHAADVWRENAALALDSTGTPWLFGGTRLKVGQYGLEDMTSRTALSLH